MISPNQEPTLEESDQMAQIWMRIVAGAVSFSPISLGSSCHLVVSTLNQ
jgi:hypothetical protein